MEVQLVSVMDTAAHWQNAPTDVQDLPGRQGRILPSSLETVHEAR